MPPAHINLADTATQLVFASGDPQCGIMCIGEAPGREEDLAGIPFVGASGKLLMNAFASIGLERESNLYITNIVPWRPPGNRTPTPQELAYFAPFAQRHIALVRPKIIILIGAVAAQTMLQTKVGITQIRGQLFGYKTTNQDTQTPQLIAEPEAALAAQQFVPITTVAESKTYACIALPILHPSYILRLPAQKKLLWHDMLTLKRLWDSSV